jgi:hypothetical protein
MMKLLSLTAIVVLLASTSGCSSSTEPGSTPLISPKIGSIFSFEGVELDENGGEVDSTRHTITHTVVGVNVEQEGRKSTQFVDQDNRALFISYMSDGDLAVLDDGWAILPITSKGETERLVQDSGYVGTSYRGRITEYYTYLGEETRTEAGESFNTTKLKYTKKVEYPQTATRNQVSLLYFSKKLGHFIRFDDQPFNVGGSVFHGSKLKLVSYALK